MIAAKHLNFSSLLFIVGLHVLNVGHSFCVLCCSTKGLIAIFVVLTLFLLWIRQEKLIDEKPALHFNSTTIGSAICLLLFAVNFQSNQSRQLGHIFAIFSFVCYQYVTKLLK